MSTSTAVELVGIVAFLTNVWANILIARKAESGWVVRLVSNVWWLAFGIAAASLANVLNAVTFAAINVYGLLRWRRERITANMNQSACADHYQILCAFCGDITRQCRCHTTTKKPAARSGICGACRAQLVAGKPAAMMISEAA